MIYRVEIPRKFNEFQYYQRSINHVLQLFGRNPKTIDRTGFEPLISELGFQVHPDLGYHFDSGLLLGPNTSLNSTNSSEPICVDSIDEYVTSLQKYLSSDKIQMDKKGLSYLEPFQIMNQSFNNNSQMQFSLLQKLY